jgi:putative transposase
MSKAKTLSFITELRLKPSPADARKLLVRFDVARQVYNACLGESLKRLRLLCDSKAFNRARKMPKGKDRSVAFREAQAAVGFREYDLHKWSTQFTSSWISRHLDSMTVQRVASTAFDAAQKSMFRIRGRPRFKRKGELRAIDGKAGSACRWRYPNIEWRGLTISAEIDEADPVVRHGVSCKVKYVRLVYRSIHGSDRFFAQLVCEGQPYCKPEHQPADGVVGVDLGPSTIAAVGEHAAFLTAFCSELENHEREIKVAQRALDRRRRANNPDNFNADGTVKRGPKRWQSSWRQRRLQTRLADLQRRQAEHRKNLHGKLIHRLLALGIDIRLESLSYKSFQSRFGRSVGFRAPGIFVARLRNAAVKYGASLVEFPTKSTKLSQFCHGCGSFSKKPLSQRWHDCFCGVSAQRDLYSAFLARFVQGETLCVDHALEAWPGACMLLDAAHSEAVQQVMGGPSPSSFGTRSGRSQNLSRRNLVAIPTKAADVVPLFGSGESRGEVGYDQGHIAIDCASPPNDV